jgi:hypothetical protein
MKAEDVCYLTVMAALTFGIVAGIVQKVFF